MNPSDIEKRLSETPAPFVRDGLHRAQLKRKLLDVIEENAMTTETSTRNYPTAGVVRTHVSRRWVWIGVAVAAASAFCVFQMWPTSLRMTAGSKLQPLIVQAPMPPEKYVLHEAGGEQRREGLRRRSLGESVEQAEVILVATPVDATIAPPKVQGDAPENLIRSVVTRVLKGKWDKKEVLTRTPTSFDEFVGKEWIIMLSPDFVAGQHPFAGMYTIELEAEIKRAIEQEKK